MPDALIAVVVALLVLPLALEILARQWVRRARPRVLDPGSRQHLETDRETEPRLEPLVRFEANGEGVRAGSETPRGPEAYRVLVAGGSAAECYLLDWPSSWPGRTEALLNEPGVLERLGRQRAHVGSIGRSRTGAEAMRLMLREVLPSYPKLDALVLMVGATDVVEWFEDGAPAEWVPPQVEAKTYFAQHPWGRFGWSPRRLALREVLRRLRERWQRPLSRRQKVGGTLAKVRRMRAEAEEILSEVPEPTVMLDRFARHFAAALKEAASHVERILVVRQPCFLKDAYDPEELAQFWTGAVGNPYHTKTTRYFDIRLIGRTMERMNERAREVAEALGHEVLDLMPRIPRDRETYYDFFHFTRPGADHVAREVVHQLLERASRPVAVA